MLNKELGKTAYLALEDGTLYIGKSYGKTGFTIGEIVFNTSHTGYQESLTDPSYVQQILVQTAPHVGNTGMNSVDSESEKIWVAGYVVREANRFYSNWRAEKSLEQSLIEEKIVGISQIDTRALTRRIRDSGAMRAGIFSGDYAQLSKSEMLEKIKNTSSMSGSYFADIVSTKNPYLFEEKNIEDTNLLNVVVVDMGVKKNTLKLLNSLGVKVTVVPATYSLGQILDFNPDGVLFSNGPGDPSAIDKQVTLLQGILKKNIPFFGICFGNQILGRALGFQTYKLPFGHRGTNQPVLDKASGKVEITAQNHGFAVEAPLEGIITAPNVEFGRVEVSHIGLNDNVVEGLRCLDLPAFSVQYHPESAAGPHDSRYLFKVFVDLMKEKI